MAIVFLRKSGIVLILLILLEVPYSDNKQPEYGDIAFFIIVEKAKFLIP